MIIEDCQGARGSETLKILATRKGWWSASDGWSYENHPSPSQQKQWLSSQKAEAVYNGYLMMFNDAHGLKCVPAPALEGGGLRREQFGLELTAERLSRTV